MDKIQKALKKLNRKEKGQLKIILEKLVQNDRRNLDIKKLKGRNDIFRVRKGGMRIIYRLDSNKNICILIIEKRNDKTYKF